jgi:hypothetical protein
LIELALQKAIGRLQSAALALDALKAAEEDNDIADRWVDFITAWKATYSKVEQAAKSTPQERQWWGRVKAEGKADPLLRYIFAARNDEEHGLVQSVERDIGLYEMHLPPQPEGTVLRIGVMPDGQFGTMNQRGEPLAQAINVAGGALSLQTVKERSGTKVAPPTSHFDDPIEAKPLPVAEAGFRYLEELVGIAVAMHTP